MVIRSEQSKPAFLVLMPYGNGSWWNIANTHDGDKLCITNGDMHAANDNTSWNGSQYTFTKFNEFGIGTISPLDRLHVNDGSMRLTHSSVSGFAQMTVTPTAGHYSSFSTVGDFVIRSTSADVIIAANSSTGAVRIGAGDPDTEHLTVLSNGNVGIGTSNPNVALAVAGTICAEEIRVALSGAPCWPDYVFDEGYELTPLSELEQRIRSEKHLPGIPSAREIESNGVELGAMQAKLLEKIEELTLYVIELEKRQQQLVDEVNELKEPTDPVDVDRSGR